MEEITLTELLIKTRNYVKKYWLILVILTVIGGVLGFLKYKKEKTFYTAEAYVSTGLKTPDLFTDINSLYAELDAVSKNITNPAWVKENLNIENSSFKSLQIIVPDYRKTYQKINNIKIRAYSYNKKDLAQLQEGLVYYFENKSHIKNIYEHTKQNKKYALDRWEKFIDKKNNVIVDDATFKAFRDISDDMPVFFYTSPFTSVKAIGPSKKPIAVYAIAFLFFFCF